MVLSTRQSYTRRATLRLPGMRLWRWLTKIDMPSVPSRTTYWPGGAGSSGEPRALHSPNVGDVLAADHQGCLLRAPSL